jgi:hypothetical protein
MTVTNGKARDVAGDAGEKAQSRMREPAGLAGDKQTKDKANGRKSGDDDASRNAEGRWRTGGASHSTFNFQVRRGRATRG